MIELAAVPYRVPEVGNVTLVAPVVKRESALLAEKVITSPPAKVMVLVFNVVVSETVRVLLAPNVRMPVPVVMVLPLKVPAAILPVVARFSLLNEMSPPVAAITTSPPLPTVYEI